MSKYIILLLFSFLYLNVSFAQEVQFGKSPVKFVNTKLKKNGPKSWFMEYNISISKDVTSPLGLKIGWVRKFGVYLKGIWNGQYVDRIEYSGFSHNDGKIDGMTEEEKVSYTGNNKIYRWSVVGGLMQNLYRRRVYCYAGGGIGYNYVLEEFNRLKSEYSEKVWYRNVDKSMENCFVLDFGLSCKLNKTIMMSFGVNAFKMKQFDANFGIGIFI